MLFCGESLLEVRGIESHELTQGLESDTMAHIIHTLFISNDVIVESFKAGDFCHHIVTIAWGLHNRVV
jgi:hypothetical protein